LQLRQHAGAAECSIWGEKRGDSIRFHEGRE
jgi:hypothetical protein